MFVGFAPYENPEIVITVILEHGYASRNAAQVAKEIFDCYFRKLYPDDFGVAQISPDTEADSEETTKPENDGSIIMGDSAE